MEHSDSGSCAAALLNRLVAEAMQRDVPHSIAEDARMATARGLRLVLDAPVSPGVRRRAEAYFSAVVRRRVVRRGTAPRAAARFVVAAVVADLRSAGRDAAGIWSELERGWSERVPDEVLEEFRLRLCS